MPDADLPTVPTVDSAGSGHITVTEAATRLGRPLRTVQHWIKTGRLPAVKLDPAKRTSAYVVDAADVSTLADQLTNL